VRRVQYVIKEDKRTLRTACSQN